MKQNVKYLISTLAALTVGIVGYVAYYSEKEFNEYFDALDEEEWSINLHSFPACGNNMTKEAIKVDKSIMSIAVDTNTTMATGKRYNGGEIGSIRQFNYGTFSVRMKNAIRPGTVSSFFLMNEWKQNDWEHKEIDIEFLGSDPASVQFTVHLYADGGRNHIYHSHLHKLGFNSSEDFHTYSIIWKKDTISWYVDDRLAHTETRIVPDTLLQIRMNHWLANPEDKLTSEWLGNVNGNDLPSFVYYDWVNYKPFKKK